MIKIVCNRNSRNIYDHIYKIIYLIEIVVRKIIYKNNIYLRDGT